MPVHEGLRFSLKALRPSLASSVIASSAIGFRYRRCFRRATSRQSPAWRICRRIAVRNMDDAADQTSRPWRPVRPTAPRSSSPAACAVTASNGSPVGDYSLTRRLGAIDCNRLRTCIRARRPSLRAVKIMIVATAMSVMHSKPMPPACRRPHPRWWLGGVLRRRNRSA